MLEVSECFTSVRTRISPTICGNFALDSRVGGVVGELHAEGAGLAGGHVGGGGEGEGRKQGEEESELHFGLVVAGLVEGFWWGGVLWWVGCSVGDVEECIDGAVGERVRKDVELTLYLLHIPLPYIRTR